MMNVPNSCNEFSYVPPNPPALLPIMDQESAMQREQHLGFNLEANTNIHMAMANPLALLPSNTGHHATIGHASQDVLQFYPSSHYLGNPYGHFGAAGTSYQSYYPSAPAAPEYYFPTLAAAGPPEDNLASFAATQLGLNLGYRTYFPPRGAYTYGHHPPRCQAEGCKADLSSAKRYHRRHKVCEHHSKAPVVVTAGGLHQRFCQQCSRFHLLDEFDDAKKSCRKRLADHNRRRRKSKPSDADGAADKRKTQANKATTRDKAGSSGKSISTVGDGLEQQVVGSSSMSKEQHQAMPGLAEVVKEVGDHKGKASMEEQTRHGSLRHHGHHAFSFPSSSGSGFLHPQSQAVSSDNTSNMAQEHEPSLALLQHHQHSNILQLGQAMFDLDFTS